jgi:hypothetical protein
VVPPPAGGVPVPMKDENARIKLSRVAKGRLLSEFNKSLPRTGTTMPVAAKNALTILILFKFPNLEQIFPTLRLAIPPANRPVILQETQSRNHGSAGLDCRFGWKRPFPNWHLECPRGL